MTKGLGAHWSLDPSITFLNHGSFGACPTAVQGAQARLRARLEAEPVRFFLREMPPLLEEARAALARFVGGDPDDLGFVGNATTGVNAVVRSLRFQEGDEILVTDHAYGACRNAIDHVCERSGARIVTVRIGFPIPTASEDEIVGALAAAASPRTRLAMIDHVTSTTGLVLPIARIVRELQGRGVDVLVDGAHAPGMVPLDVQAIGAAFYTGNCHKWLCAPKGAAFLHVRRDRQDRVHPTTISHGRNAVWMKGSQFRKEFDWVGTTDPTAWLCVPEAIRVIGGLVPGGWDEVRRRNRELALAGRRLLCERLGVEAPCPESMIGSLASIPIGRRGLEAGAGTGPGTAGGLDPLQETLFAQGIEVPVMPWGEGGRLLRISAQLYNDVAQFERLASAVVEAAA